MQVVSSSAQRAGPDARIDLTERPVALGGAEIAVFGRLVARSPVMRATLERLRRVAERDCSVLLEGDSGTGKELAAQALHAASARSSGPFVVIDCAGTAPAALELELFGSHAVDPGRRGGAFVQAEGGTVFLDEIGALSPELQLRLLRVVEHRQIKAAGPGPWQSLNVRFVATTNRNLALALAQGAFRPELYYRLAVTSVRLPALAERPDDIPLLCQSLLVELGARDGMDYHLDEATLDRFRRQPWPGNVRELRNALERFAVFGAEAWEQEPGKAAAGPGQALQPFHAAKAGVVADFESSYLRAMLLQQRGNITAAAAAAGVDRVHFLRLLDRHGLRKPSRQ